MRPWPEHFTLRIAAALALLALVALASTARSGGGSATAPGWLDLAVLITAAALVATLAVVGLLSGVHASFAGTQRRTKLLAGGVAALLLISVVSGSLYSFRGDHRFGRCIWYENASHCKGGGGTARTRQ